MKGQMMEAPLTPTHFLERSARFFGDKEVGSFARDGSHVRLGWRSVRDRAARLADALLRLGVRRGDRVATLAWNTHRHLELYYAVPAVGAVLHTINGRLAREQVARIVGYAGDRFLFVDPELAPLVEGLAGPERRVAMDGAPPGPEWLDYEALLREGSPLDSFPSLPEKRSRHPLLYVGHDGRAQRCALFPPCFGAAHVGDLSAQRVRAHGSRPHPARRPHVPRQRLGASVRGRAGGSFSDSAGTASKRCAHRAAARAGSGDHRRGRPGGRSDR